MPEDDDPPPLFERTRDDIERDIRNGAWGVIPDMGLDQFSEGEEHE
jgi:hypothetical protein